MEMVYLKSAQQRRTDFDILSFFQLHSEVSQDFRFPRNVVPFLYFVASVVDIFDGDSDVIHVIVGVRSARNRKPYEFEFWVAVLSRLWITVG